MGLVLATTAGLVIWLVLWAIGQKAIDAFMITLLIVVLALAGRMLAPYLPGRQE